jgi:hypothetical protein
MPVPSSINDLSTAPGVNSPSGSESPSTTDNYMRTIFAFIAQLRDGKLATGLSVLLTGAQTIEGVKTFSDGIVGNVTGNVSGSAGSISGTVGISSGGTGQTTAAAAFGALKQDATQQATGVVELATNGEAQGGTDNTRAITAANLTASQLGRGQTWQNLTAGRAAGTAYQNTSGRPIFIAARYLQSGAGTATMFVDGVEVSYGQQATVSGGQTLSAIVPNASFYQVNVVSNTISYWTELR